MRATDSRRARLATVRDLLELWGRENWKDDAWVAELRRSIDPLRRAGYGEEWWAGFQSGADAWWEDHRLHMKDVTSRGWGDRRLRNLSFTLAARWGVP
jgi:hypothetical protein